MTQGGLHNICAVLREKKFHPTPQRGSCSHKRRRSWLRSSARQVVEVLLAPRHLPRHGAAVLQPRPLRSDLEATPSIRWMTMKYNYDEAWGSVLDEKVIMVVICALYNWNQINITKWNFWSPCLCLQNMILNDLLITFTDSNSYFAFSYLATHRVCLACPLQLVWGHFVRNSHLYYKEQCKGLLSSINSLIHILFPIHIWEP